MLKHLASMMTAIALAAPLTANAIVGIEMNSDQFAPAHTEPGQVFSASCIVHEGVTTPDRLEVEVFDPLGQVIYSWESTSEMTHDLSLPLEADAVQGIYRLQATYYAAGIGLAAQRGVGFIVISDGICAFKFIDDDADGVFDQDFESLAEGWEICGVSGPELLDCKFTDADGVACWFFLPEGIYELCETQQEGWEATTGECLTIDLILGEVGKVFFGNHMPGTPTESITWGKVKTLYGR